MGVLINPSRFAVVGGGGVTIGDPYFASVMVLTHFDGANGGTSFPDNAPTPVVWTATGATTATSPAMFGTAVGNVSSGGYLHTTVGSIGTGDYSIEVQVYPTSVSAGYKCVLMFDTLGAGLYLKGNQFLWYEAGSDRCISAAITANARYAVHVRRVSGVVSLYVNNAQSPTTFASGAGALTGSLYVGASGAGSEPLTGGSVDELRITKVAREVLTQSAPFPDVYGVAAHQAWRMYSYSSEGAGGYMNLDMISLRASPGGVNQAIGAPGITTTQDSNYTGIYPSLGAFLETGLWHSTNAEPHHWAAIDFGAGVYKSVAELAMRDANTGLRGPLHFKLQSSDDAGATWQDRALVLNETGWSVGTIKTFAISDPYVQPHTLALLHLDSSATDDAGNTWTTGGSPSYDTSVKKFGTASYQGAAGSYITATNAAFARNHGSDFTYRGWIYHSSDPGNNGIFGTRMSSSSAGAALARVAGGWTIYMGASVLSASGSMPLNVWNHFELSRKDGILRLFFNGVNIYQVANQEEITDTALYVGGYYSTSYCWPGKIDEFEFLPYALHDANFAVPTAASVYA